MADQTTSVTDLSTLRDRARSTAAQINWTVTGQHRFTNLNWARQMFHEAPPSERLDHRSEAEAMVLRATGLNDIGAAMALLDYVVSIVEDWKREVEHAMERMEIPWQLKGPAIAYARMFFLLPDEAIAHVTALPELERNEWFYGRWTPPQRRGEE